MTIVAKVARSYTPADFLIPHIHVEIRYSAMDAQKTA
jgi:hypothetical protein